VRNLAVTLLVLSLLLPGARAQAPAQPPLKAEEIDQLAAPIALYPDALVAQILMAATYPLEVVQAARWSKANPNLKDKALEDALQKESWEASVKSLAAFPQVLAMMNEKLDWTQKLGDAFLGQQQEVMDAIQRLRLKAHESGNLKSTKEQTVSVEQASGTTIVKIEPSDPKVVYVPAYDPMVVYAPWPYPAYPPYYYYPPGYAAGPVVWFSVGIIVGGALWGGCHWGHGGGVYISHHNHYNSFNRTNINTGNWNHKVEHRKGAEYRDAGSRDKYGGGQRPGVDSREAFRGRADAGRQDLNRAGAGAFDGAGRGGRDAVSHSNRGAASRGGTGGFSGGAGGFSGGGMRGGMGGGGMRGGGGRR
jgi:uncharacterized membrane protein YgcG